MEHFQWLECVISEPSKRQDKCLSRAVLIWKLGLKGHFVDYGPLYLRFVQHLINNGTPSHVPPFIQRIPLRSGTMQAIFRHLGRGRLKHRLEPTFYTAHPSFRCRAVCTPTTRLLLRHHKEDRILHPGKAVVEEGNPIHHFHGR